MNHPPSQIILNWLWDEGHAVSIDGDWRGFRGNMPDKPDKAIAVYDTDGVPDGRIIDTGELILHPTLQIRVRAIEYNDGWIKAQGIAEAMDAIVNDAFVPVDSTGAGYYRINAVSRLGGILHNGLEASVVNSSTRRHIFTFNVQLTLKQE